MLKTLCEATASDKPLTTVYGGIVGISLFGPKAVDAFLLPLMLPYWEKWDKALSGNVSQEELTELQHCQEALLV